LNINGYSIGQIGIAAVVVAGYDAVFVIAGAGHLGVEKIKVGSCVLSGVHRMGKGGVANLPLLHYQGFKFPQGFASSAAVDDEGFLKSLYLYLHE